MYKCRITNSCSPEISYHLLKLTLNPFIKNITTIDDTNDEAEIEPGGTTKRFIRRALISDF